MKTKKVLLGVVAVVLTILISIAATIAYLTGEVTADNVMTIGKVDINLLEYQRVDTEYKDADEIVEEFVDGKLLVPAVTASGFSYDFGESDTAHVKWDHDSEGSEIKAGYTSPIWDPAKLNNEVDKMVFVENAGDYSAYVRVFFAFEAGNFDTFDKFEKNIHINLNDNQDEWVWEWVPFLAEIDGEKYFVAQATYQKELEPKSLTEISLSQIALDSNVDNEDSEAFGDDYHILVNAQAIQAAGFEEPEEALDEGFGEDIPFGGITFETGIDLKTALHNLNGDATKPITAKVEKVTFGLNATYPEIVDGYPATFTSAEQDVPVYTYYVPNDDASKYDVYVLADDTIYTPKISQDLFRDMTALTAVDTTNMDVSRTENMTYMFRGCTKLTSIDTSKWNTERVQTLKGAFWECSSLAKLDVSKWNTANVTDMYATFYLCDNIGEFEVGGWNVSNVTNMAYMFNRCSSITSLDVDSWNVGSVTTMSNMFAGCTALETLNVSEWDVSKVVDFQWFIACFSPSNPMKIKSLDVSEWNTGSATNMFCMFYNCTELNDLNVSNWNVSNVTTLANMFEKCKALETLNLSKWDVSNVENMNGLFYECQGLTGLNLSGWNTAKVASMGYMFISCNKLTELDLSSWNTNAVKKSEKMFAGCSNLVTISVGNGWNMTNSTSSANMFLDCVKLVGGAGTAYNEANANNNTYAIVDGAPANPGYLTKKPAQDSTGS